MKHLLISREFPPSPYPAGGIGTYVGHIADLLAAHGEIVHVIAQQWPGAPRAREVRLGGRLTVHRVPLEARDETGMEYGVLDALRRSISCSGFLINATRLAESLIEHAGIDIVEAQDYEAPAYLLLLRRSTTGESRRRVPVLVHLHTPTEFVFKANGWERDLAACGPIAHLERSAIRAADALLCPSRFLARIAESQFELESGAVAVIPYPKGDTPLLHRNEEIWRNGTICYAGRLEPRKGVVEWMDAAVAVARDSTARFAFVGGDVPASGSAGGSVRDLLFGRLPDELRTRFEFPGAVPRDAVVAHLRRARCAVVPSRWENFPYACVEAMASGLPVLVSPSGGMAEMVEDGRTGWIADGADARSLERALRRVLQTPPKALARMGADAADSIAARCANQRLIREHIEFRRHVVSLGCRTDRAAPLPVPAALAADPVPAQGRTMGPVDILRACPQQRREVLRRAIANPSYVAKWLAWQGRTLVTRLGALAGHRRAEVILLILLCASALAVRLPNLMVVPRFEDEGLEALWGLDITSGARLPLTGADPYYGPLFSYLVAGAFWLFGPHLALPRLVAVVFGTLTVPATYWLGRVAYGRRTALIAALLALSSRSLITVSSHYGWSNSLSPFFATIALAAFCDAQARGSRRLLILGAACAALTVQSHPITATLVIGIGLWSLLPSSIRSAFRLREIGLAVAVFLIGYSPVLWASASSGSVSILAIGATRPYAFLPAASSVEYVQRLLELCRALWVTTVRGAGFYWVLGFALNSHRTMATVAGLTFWAWMLRASLRAQGEKRLLGMVLLSSLVVMPLVVHTFYDRYLAYLLPLAYVLLGAALANILTRPSPVAAPKSDGQPLRLLRTAVAGALLVAFTATPLITLTGYERGLGAQVGTNRTFFNLLKQLSANGVCADKVFLEDLEAVATARSDYWAYFTSVSTRYILTLNACPFELRPTAQLLDRLDQDPGSWMILSDRTARAASERVALRKVADIAPAASSSADLRLALYSLERDDVFARR